jgi:hypothetical protein
VPRGRSRWAPRTDPQQPAGQIQVHPHRAWLIDLNQGEPRLVPRLPSGTGLVGSANSASLSYVNRRQSALGKMKILAEPRPQAFPGGTATDWMKFATMFRQRQRSRWAAVMLFLWLFGVGHGIANACSVVPGSPVWAPFDAWRDMGAVVGHPHDDQHAIAAQAADDQVAVPASDAQDPPDCVDCCETANDSDALLKSVFDGLQCHAPAPPAVATGLRMPVFTALQASRPRRGGVLAPAISISFLRLAL